MAISAGSNLTNHPTFRYGTETGPGLESTKAGTKQLFAMMKAGFPDLRFDAEDILESGDKVVARARVTGTNKGEFMGIPASGKSIDIQACETVFIPDGYTLGQALTKLPVHWPGTNEAVGYANVALTSFGTLAVR